MWHQRVLSWSPNATKHSSKYWEHPWKLSTLLILIRPCAIQSRFPRFRCLFFLLYFTEPNAPKIRRTKQSRYNTRGNECKIFNKYMPNTWLHTNALCNITWMKHLKTSNTSKGKQSRLLRHTFYTWWWPVRPKHVK
jgi:hypothetical protein